MAGLLAATSLTATRGNYAFLILVGVIVALLGTVAGLAFLNSRIRSGPEDIFWTGLVSFDEDDFGETARFPNLYRSRKQSAGRQGLTGGRLRIEKGGIYWKAGSLLTPGGQIHGSFIIPWPTVKSVDVSDIPYKSKVLGGAIRVYFTSGDQHLYGELLGSRKGLMHGLLQSPLGPMGSTSS